MRIISQDNTLDLQYEQIGISINQLINESEIIAFRHNAHNPNDYWTMASYSTLNEAKKVLGFISAAYKRNDLVFIFPPEDSFNNQDLKTKYDSKKEKMLYPKEYKCKKCSGEDLFLSDSGNHKGLYCSFCGNWFKWVSKKDLPFIEQFVTRKQSIE